MTERKFYITRITVEVLSEEPLACSTLAAVAAFIDDGPGVGRVKADASVPVNASIGGDVG